MRKIHFLFTSCFLLTICTLFWGFSKQVTNSLSADSTVSEALVFLGGTLPDHARPEADSATIRRGFELVHQGRTIGPDGKRSKYISKYYFCTSCHNQVQEDPVLFEMNPETRLEYAAKNDLKFLPASTFLGIANRESWYNDDYYKKYGDLVKPANKSLAEATQLCAKVCSSGRYLEEWELEAILAYYWDIQLKLGDLGLTKQEWAQLNSSQNKQDARALLKSKYALRSPATFGDVPADKSKGFSYSGDPKKGEKIYSLSCMACHQEGGVSDVSFDYSKLTFQKFLRNLDHTDAYNLYEICRYGTYADKGKPRYMPLYPKERMSDKQLEDLRAYIEQEAS
ncbi:MAG: cytochrome c [Vicingaceae bacterium]